MIPALFSLDSYKLGHADQYPEGTEMVYSNFTPRSLKHFKVPEAFANNTIIAYGMYDTIRTIVETFNDTFFSRDIEEVLLEAQTIYPFFAGNRGFDYQRIRELWELGYLPLDVWALPEGAHVTPQIPVLTLKNNASQFFWLTNFIETWISNTLWKPMVSATISWNYRQILLHYALKTGSALGFVDWQAHDFSLRGMSGMEDGARTGVGHLLSFTGTDNLAAVWYAMQAYEIEPGALIGGSVPATEHSVMSCGSKISELATFARLITAVYPTGIVSIVSDTWDFWRVITEYAKILKPTIMGRDGKVVFRPDSGDPADIICGTARIWDSAARSLLHFDYPVGYYKDKVTGTYFYKYSPVGYNKIEEPTPEMKGAIECLWNIFGGTVTDKGYRMLDEHVGLIYGDSITMERADDILARLQDKGYASGNVVLGIGSYTFQYVTRDTIGAAMKATYAEVNGEPVLLSKDPATDPGKKSATGILYVDRDEENDYILYDRQKSFGEGELELIFSNGEFSPVPRFQDIRDRVRRGN
jgi:nicotinamide phosphoribosyltransferase